MNRQKGFTLIELVVVIVILGLLAATALPRFIDLTGDARLASVQGVAGGLRSAASLAKAQWLVNGSTGATSVSMDGVTVAVNASGYPTAAANGIGDAMQGLDGFTPDYSGAPNAVFQPTNGGGLNCRATYDENTGTVTVAASSC